MLWDLDRRWTSVVDDSDNLGFWCFLGVPGGAVALDITSIYEKLAKAAATPIGGFPKDRRQTPLAGAPGPIDRP